MCLLPYVAHALQMPDGKDIQYSESGSSGMMIMDMQGTILIWVARPKIAVISLSSDINRGFTQ